VDDHDHDHDDVAFLVYRNRQGPSCGSPAQICRTDPLAVLGQDVGD
jgi:hypothetical protein